MTEPRDPMVPEPLQRRAYQAAELMRQHPGVLRNENKQVIFAIACPAGAVHSGPLEYSRWPDIPLPFPREVDPVSAARLAMVRRPVLRRPVRSLRRSTRLLQSPPTSSAGLR